jgi:short-subunit dehydrogenase
MRALITGASSGIGLSMAKSLSARGYDLILVARSKDKLEALKNELTTDVQIIPLDISSTFNCMKLYNKVKKTDIDLLVNNAGFGVFGLFDKTSLDKELDMIDLNVKTVHTLTKLFLQDFKKKDKGYILNVASSAAFLSGPLMASYYGTKSYVLKITEAIYEELKQSGSNVHISCLCPGPVATGFNEVAKVNFSSKPLTSDYVAEYTLKQMDKHKLHIIPGWHIHSGVIMTRFMPTKLLLKLNYLNKKKKNS